MGIRSRLGFLTSIMVSPIYSTITFLTSAKTILLLLELLDQTKLHLQSLFFEIESIFIGSEIKEGKKDIP